MSETALAFDLEVSSALNDPRMELPRPEEDPELSAFIEAFKQRFGRELVAVIMTGSCLSSITKSKDSFRDFFVILDSYRSTGHFLKRIFHRILPPDLYHLAVDMPDGRKVHCKYYILAMDDLIRTTGPAAPDLYVLGRLSKRVSCVYRRNPAADILVTRALAQATERAVRIAAALVKDRIEEDAFYKLVLQISYLAEQRLEDERKIEGLFAAGEAYYRRVYGRLVTRLIEEGELSRIGGNMLMRGPRPAMSRTEAWRFIKASRIRAWLRWPKMIVTVDNWLDQILAKAERTHGIKIDVPGWERPVILITGWRHYFRLKRQGKVR